MAEKQRADALPIHMQISEMMMARLFSIPLSFPQRQAGSRQMPTIFTVSIGPNMIRRRGTSPPNLRPTKSTRAASL